MSVTSDNEEVDREQLKLRDWSTPPMRKDRVGTVQPGEKEALGKIS